jgi:hypothetical protein
MVTKTAVSILRFYHRPWEFRLRFKAGIDRINIDGRVEGRLANFALSERQVLLMRLLIAETSCSEEIAAALDRQCIGRGKGPGARAGRPERERRPDNRQPERGRQHAVLRDAWRLSDASLAVEASAAHGRRNQRPDRIHGRGVLPAVWLNTLKLPVGIQ